MSRLSERRSKTSPSPCRPWRRRLRACSGLPLPVRVDRLQLCSLCGPWATIWFPASHQAKPYRKLYSRSPAVRCRDGLHPVENVPHPAGGAGGGRTVARVGSPCRSRRGFVGRIGVKCPETASKRRFLEEYATWPITAQLLFQNKVMSRIAVRPSPERNRRNLIEHIHLQRNHGAPNSRPQPAHVASCSMLAPAEWGVLYPEQRGASTAGPAPMIVGRAMAECHSGAGWRAMLPVLPTIPGRRETKATSTFHHARLAVTSPAWSPVPRPWSWPEPEWPERSAGRGPWAWA